jgi:hypothetical protein
MMAALAAGGLPLLRDGRRPPDSHNPRGYFEDARVLELPRRAEWLRGQQGKGVKILSHLLAFIPGDVPAKVLFMRRPLPQVLASQNAMLECTEDPLRWARLVERDLARTLRWLEEQEHLDVLEVFYTALLEDPGAGFRQVVEFLGGHWDLESMVAAVDPSLHHQRS